MRREDLRVAVHVAAAAGRHFEYIHVQSQFLVPGQESVVVVDLHAGGTVVFGDERAGRLRIAEMREKDNLRKDFIDEFRLIKFLC